MEEEDFDVNRRNYRLKNGLAYTFDNILIYNVFVYNIPKKVTEKEVLEYFSTFGKIKSVVLFSGKRRTRKPAPKTAFVKFEDASDAARLLERPHSLQLQLEQVDIAACNTWHQPGVSTTKSTKKKLCAQNIQDKNSFNITTLNDDCLTLIYKKLSFRDQVRLSLTCKRLKDVFALLCKAKYKNLRLKDLNSLTLFELREFFFISGAHIESVRGDPPPKYHENIAVLLRKCCPNIISLNLSSTNLKPTLYYKLFDRIKNCTKVDLNNCNIKDYAIIALKKLPNLKYLSLAENIGLTGKYINNLTTVEVLILYGCCGIRPNRFASIIKSLRKLRCLDIQECQRLKKFPISIIGKLCCRLESLKLFCSIESQKTISRFPKVKKLEIIFTARTITLCRQFLEELVQNRVNQIELLQIVDKNSINIDRARQISLLTKLKRLVCSTNDILTDECLECLSNLKNLQEIDLSSCKSITNEGVLQLVQCCTKLKKVHLEFNPHITNDFIYNVIKVLKATENQRGKPCYFYVAMSGVGKNVTKNAEYLAARNLNLLQLSFHFPAEMDEDLSQDLSQEFNRLLNYLPIQYGFYNDVDDDDANLLENRPVDIDDDFDSDSYGSFDDDGDDAFSDDYDVFGDDDI